jgi:hypothetical protein
MRAIDGEFPLAPEVTFLASLGRGRDDGDKQRAVADLLADLVVPRISAAQLALVEPDLDAARPQRLANAPRRLGILRGVAQEYGLSRLRHRGVLPLPQAAEYPLRGSRRSRRDGQLIRIRPSAS